MKKLRTPFPHQREALAAIAKGLRKEARGQVLSATGTGKSLTALWAFKQHAKSAGLVLVPSLALARQIFREWRATDVKNNAAKCDWLVVCSDGTVVETDETPEEYEAAKEDIKAAGGEVVNDSKAVRRFLTTARRRPLVVLSTYQSAPIVGAGLPKGFKFDLAIFDEAHKTAGASGKLFSYALRDANIPIVKRLFFTATPRHSRYKKKSGEMREVFHMNDREVYGPVLYDLPYKEAVKRGIVVDFKVVVAVLDGQAVTRKELYADMDAALIGKTIQVSKTALQYDLKKIFSFHATNAGTQGAQRAEGLYKHHMKGFSVFRVDGTQSAKLRDNTMDQFRDAKKAIVTNSRCLGEGVDVPACDAVAFLSARKSKVDVVQAVGRATRKSPGKKRAIVILPIFAEQGETRDEALKHTAYRDAFDTLNALREYDESLAEEIRRIREYVIRNPETDPGPQLLDGRKLQIDLSALVNKKIAGLTLSEFRQRLVVQLAEQLPMTIAERKEAILEKAKASLK